MKEIGGAPYWGDEEDLMWAFEISTTDTDEVIHISKFEFEHEDEVIDAAYDYTQHREDWEVSYFHDQGKWNWENGGIEGPWTYNPDESYLEK